MPLLASDIFERLSDVSLVLLLVTPESGRDKALELRVLLVYLEFISPVAYLSFPLNNTFLRFDTELGSYYDE